MFRVQADGSVQMDVEKKKQPDQAAPQMVDWQNPPAREAQEGDWLAAPPPLPGQQVRPSGPPMAGVVQPGGYPPMAGVVQQTSPMAQVVPMGNVVPAYGDAGDSYSTPESSYTPGDYSYGKKKNRFLVILIGLVVLLVGASGFGYWLFQQNINRNTVALKKLFLEKIDKRQWEDAQFTGKSYREKITDPTEIKEVEFGIALADLQQQLTPAQLKSKDQILRAVGTIQEFFKNKKADPGFRTYRKELTESAFNLVKIGSEFLETNPDSAMHDSLQPVLKLAIETGNQLADKDMVKAWTDETEKKYTGARTMIDASLAKKNWQVRLDDVLAKENLGQIDAVQSEYQDLVKKHPLLLNDADLSGKLSGLKQVEPGWVKYSTSNSAPINNKPSFGPSIRICPPVKTPDGVQDDSGIVLAMSRGTLYGLSARSGKDRWALRVGQDVRDLPPRVSLGGNVPDLAFVVTTEEAGQTYLSQMNLVSGERSWTRKLNSACPAGALLISNNRLVVPLKETIAIVEAGSGKMTGYFTIAGYEISSLPAHDKARDRLFVPVDRGRIFVLDLAAKKCVGVIYTEHGSGQVKGAPIVIDDLMVACIATGSGSGSTRIRAYDISAKGPTPEFEPPIGIFEMPGHASTSPYVDGNETLGVVSDQGLLWLFGIGKSSTIGTSQSKGKTPFYPLTAKPMALKLQTNSELKKDQPRPRVQVAHVTLNDWWVFSHDYLIRNVYDPFRGAMYPLANGSLALGSPLHRAELSPDGRMLVVVTQTRGQAQMLASGIDRTTGTIIWQTQLGTEASQDPVALAGAVAMLDRGGAVFSVKASEILADSAWQVCGSWPALPLVAASHRLLKAPNGKTLVSMSFDPIRARIILRKIDSTNATPMAMKQFPHTVSPAGTPIALDDGSALVPCKDGNIYLFNFTTGASSSLFSWRDPAAFSNAVGHLLMPSPDVLMSSNGLNKVLRWTRLAQGVWKKVPNDLELPTRIATELIALPGQRVGVGDDAGNLHSLALATLGTSKQWNVKGTITRGPFLVGADGIGCVVDGKRFWWINNSDEEEGKVYGNAELASIIGEPTVLGDDVLLAVLQRDPTLGMLASYVWLNPTTGKLLYTEKLPEGIAPSSGATPLGKDRAFAPLSDGTVRILTKPTATAASNP